MIEDGEVLQVLFVCTGNRARSPIAAALLKRYADESVISVSSAGTLELGRLAGLPLAVEAAAELDVDLRAHTTRSLVETDLSSADLVIGFEPSHVAAAVARGAAPERSFMLPELVSLLHPGDAAVDPVTRARAAIAEAHARRSAYAVFPAPSIADPLGKPAAVMRSTAREIDRQVSQLARLLFGD